MAKSLHTLCMVVLVVMLCATWCVVPVEGSETRSTSLLMTAARRSKTKGRTNLLSGYRYSMQDPAARTLLTLDKNKDGRIDPEEVANFATMQGLDAESAKEEFSGIDANHDGVLDSQELTAVLGSDAPPASPPQRASLTATVETPASALKVEPVQSSAKLPAAQTSPQAQAGDLATHVDMAELHDKAMPQDISSLDVKYNSDAQAAAADVVKELSFEEQEETAASALERQAAEFRANSTAMARSTMQNALEAGAKAARDKANSLLANINKLEDQAERAEVRAAALHAKAKAEMKEANELMGVTQQALS